MRAQRLLLFFVIPAAAAFGQSSRNSPDPVADQTSGNSPAPLTAKQKAALRLNNVISPMNLISVAAGAGIDQLRGSPRGWQEGTEGYAIRLASAEGFVVADNAIALSLDVPLHLDPRYRRKPEADFKARMWNAFDQTLFANKDGGGRMINVPVIAGNFGAAFISNTWQPSSEISSGDALMRGALSIAYHVGKNMGHEFIPDLVSHFKHKHIDEDDKAVTQ